MSDIKFACPHCQQHIQAEAGYAGMTITCPACHAGMVVPGQAPARAPVPAFSVAAPPPPVPALAPAGAPTSAPVASGCPSCGAPLARGTVLCTKCGYNLATGQRLQGKALKSATKARVAPGQESWAKNPNVWAGIVAGIFALLYGFARLYPAGALAYVGLAVLFYVAIRITVLVFAFGEGAGTGFMTLCIPFYDLYFVYGINENRMLKNLYTISLLGVLAVRTLSLST
jgi:hypothetical protein